MRIFAVGLLTFAAVAWAALAFCRVAKRADEQAQAMSEHWRNALAEDCHDYDEYEY